MTPAYRCLPFLVPALVSALSVEEIRQRLQASAASDTVDVWLTTTVQATGFSFASNSHLISKGPDKMWLEQEMPDGKQRIVRNGSRTQITDLKTGKRVTPESPPSLPGVSAPQGFLRDGRYQSPQSLGNGRHLVRLVPGSDSTVIDRAFTYDATANQIKEFTQAGKMQDTTRTVFTYCSNCSLPFLKTIEIRAKMEGKETVVRMEYKNAVKPKRINDQLFEIHE